jgi:mannosyl-oligosaccharide alpha-1,2-mannosidase
MKRAACGTTAQPRRGFLKGLGAAAIVAGAPPGQAKIADAAPASMPSARSIADDVRSEFLHAWRAYRRIAWGHDELRPISAQPHEFYLQNHSFGLSIIEALDTLYVMELDDELAAAVDWLAKHLDFDVDGDVEMFEATIRMVGGLLAGHLATGDRFLLDRARDLADRLLPAFAKSPTGVPYRFVNLRTGAVSEPVTNLAEAGTNVLEFGTLSRLTVDPRYLAASKKAYKAVLAMKSPLDLLATKLNVETGEWADPISVAPNPPADSFYEYLWGGWALVGDADCRDWYRLLTDAMLKHQLQRTGGLVWFRQVDYRTGAPTSHRQSELAAFYAELLAQGGDRRIGQAYFDSWTGVLEKYVLPPEEIDYATLEATDPGYELRPEYANSAFDLWLLTRDDRYRSSGHAHFLQMKRNCRVDNGYTVLKDVRPVPVLLGDLTPGYWFAENMKYLYLLFADSPRFDYAHNYLSTEGKILSGLLPRR